MPRYRPMGERLAAFTVDGPNGCRNFIGCMNNDGYGTIRAPRSRKMLKAHRVAYELAYGPIPNGLEVMHRCDNRACVNPAHLAVGSHAANMNDMATKGRSAVPRPRGKRLTAEDVRMIRSVFCGFRARTISQAFGVSADAIRKIRQFTNWSTI